MRFDRILFGNIAHGGETGWRVIGSSSRLNRSSEEDVVRACTDALESDLMPGISCLCAGRKIKEEWVFVYGTMEGVDSHGRPGGWLFRCALSSGYNQKQLDPEELLLWIFSDELDWNPSEALSPVHIDKSAPSISLRADELFFKGSSTVLAELRNLLLKVKRREQSFIFPVASPNSSFFINLNHQGKIMASKKTFKGQRTKSIQTALSLLLIALSLILGFLLYTEVEEHNATKIALNSEIKQQRESIDTLRDNLENSKQESEKLKNKISENNDKLSEMKNIADEKDEKIERLERKVSDFSKNANEALQNDIDKANTERDEAKAERDEYKGVLKQLIEIFEEDVPDMLN